VGRNNDIHSRRRSRVSGDVADTDRVYLRSLWYTAARDSGARHRDDQNAPPRWASVVMAVVSVAACYLLIVMGLLL